MWAMWNIKLLFLRGRAVRETLTWVSGLSACFISGRVPSVFFLSLPAEWPQHFPQSTLRVRTEWETRDVPADVVRVVVVAMIEATWPVTHNVGFFFQLQSENTMRLWHQISFWLVTLCHGEYWFKYNDFSAAEVNGYWTESSSQEQRAKQEVCSTSCLFLEFVHRQASRTNAWA